ncbi:Ctr-domain-containing protein [Macrolepiota fuliginosa MF-IS2]|uniref:Copper transport protein n=1 Tax=Macrolepiota fuliginosa MF-IS2 TaxID=1400762 RepID=A0A9P5XBE5_9AGAR|nr:Ctr-domain-containing protein [Macrolepiota fuliginosa MF-IS2]
MNHDHSMHIHDHSGHGGHDMPMPHQCTMDMLWNANIIDTCIVFRSWHITSTTAFIVSFFIIVGLGVFYEYLRLFARRFDQQLALSLSAKGKNRIRLSSTSTSPERGDDDSGLLTGRRAKPHLTITVVPLVPRLLRAGLYGSTVFLSFFLMLVFMTYNAYLILAVVVGAGLGHFIFGSTLDTDAILGETNGKGMACH